MTAPTFPTRTQQCTDATLTAAPCAARARPAHEGMHEYFQPLGWLHGDPEVRLSW